MLLNREVPIFIVSKGRWQSRLTSKALEYMQVPYYIVVEKQEYEQYASVIDSEKILILPAEYLEQYDTCDDLGSSKSKGPGAARNFCWDYSTTYNAKWHWVIDDNIYSLPTPTSGFSIIFENNMVQGALRHSYHQTL